jgi:hypothetical protein
MALQKSVAVRNAQLDALESTIGASAVLRIYTGAAPANCAAANSGTLLAEMTLPSDWMAAASAGAKSLAGVWEDLVANNSGDAGHFRVYESTATTCHLQGTVSRAAANGGTGDLKLNQATEAIVAGQKVTINTFTLTGGGA